VVNFRFVYKSKIYHQLSRRFFNDCTYEVAAITDVTTDDGLLTRIPYQRLHREATAGCDVAFEDTHNKPHSLG